jgi:hypothetical protein
MEQSSSQEANISSVFEIACVLWYPAVYYHVYRSWPLFLILNQMNLVHASPSHFFKIHFNIILLCTLRSLQWSISLTFLHHNPVITCLLANMWHVLHHSHSVWFDQSEDIGVEYISWLWKMMSVDVPDVCSANWSINGWNLVYLSKI